MIWISDVPREPRETAVGKSAIPVHAEAIRAAVSLVRPDQSAQRLLLFVDSSTQTDLRRLRGATDWTNVAVSLGDVTNLGGIHVLTPWLVDAGVFPNAESLRTALPTELNLHSLEDLEHELHDGQTAEGPDECPNIDQVDSSAGEYVLAQGTMKGSLRHGLWTYVNHRGELRKLELYRLGCLSESILPSVDTDTKRLQNQMSREEE